MSEHITVGELCAQHIGRTIQFPFEDEFGNNTGELVQGRLLHYEMREYRGIPWVTFSIDDGTPWGCEDTFVATAPMEVLDEA